MVQTLKHKRVGKDDDALVTYDRLFGSSSPVKRTESPEETYSRLFSAEATESPEATYDRIFEQRKPSLMDMISSAFEGFANFTGAPTAVDPSDVTTKLLDEAGIELPPPVQISDPNDPLPELIANVDSGVEDSNDVDFEPEKGPDKRAGFWEAAGRDFLEKIPFSPVGMTKQFGLFQAARRLSNPESFEAYAAHRAKVGRRLEVWGMNMAAQTGAMLRSNYTTGTIAEDIDIESLMEADRELLTRHFEEQEARAEQGFTFAGKVGQGLSHSAPWMIEFMFTGGLKKLATTAAKRGFKRVLSKAMAEQVAVASRKTVAGKVARKVGSTVIGAGSRTTLQDVFSYPVGQTERRP